MEGQGAGVDTEVCVPAQHFNVPILEVEGPMRVIVVWSIGGLSSEASGIVESDRVATLTDEG